MKKFKICKSVHHRNSAELVASVDDLLIQILPGLPIKSLIRFKSVSKHWQSLIMNPTFCHQRSRKINPAIGLFLPVANSQFEYVPFYPNKTNPQVKKIEFIKDPSGISIVQSCNGLFLCYSFRAQTYNSRYFVYNPTTKRFSTLPKLEGEGVYGIRLCFDPSKSPHYKAVGAQKINLDSSEYQYQILIYSSDTGLWRVINESFTAPYIFLGDGVYWNGAVHWISSSVAAASLYLNIEHQVFKKMPMPQVPEGWQWHWRNNYYFGESCDHLHFIGIYGQEVEFNVYEMKRDYSEWFVKYRVDISVVIAVNLGMLWDPIYWKCNDTFSIFCMVRGKEEDDSFMVLQIQGKAIRYNLVSKTFKKIHEFGGAKVDDSVSFPSTKGFQYIESLSCV